MTFKCLNRYIIDPPIECKSGECFKVVVSHSVDKDTHELDNGVITSVEKVVNTNRGILFDEEIAELEYIILRHRISADDIIRLAYQAGRLSDLELTYAVGVPEEW